MFTHSRLGLLVVSVTLVGTVSCQAASWTLDMFKNSDGSPYTTVGGPTVIAQGPDGRFYVGGRGKVTALTVNDDYYVTDVCVSENFGEDRSVLGIAFDPRKFDENDIYFYIATSTLNWGGGQSGDPQPTDDGWQNGKVQVMRSNVNGQCLGVVMNLVTGLSVSNHDHGVNALLVGMNGKLYVSVGGMTNAGYAEKGDGDGGSPETPFSGAVLEVNFNRNDFNGDIRYDSTDGRVANVIGRPNIKIYAQGFMNAYGMELHTNGRIYLVDNGPNPGYGRQSTSCTTNLETDPHYQDKFLLLKRKAWYGHANRNRGRNDPKQCVFQPIGANASGQEPALRQIESSTNGITEYSANILGSEFKGTMCFARIGFGQDPGKTFALFMNGRGNRVTGREEIMAEGGLDMKMDRLGSLITPDFTRNTFKVIRPVPAGEFAKAPVAVISVLPKYGPPEGGKKIWVTAKFPAASTASVWVGQSECTNAIVVNYNTITCFTPRGAPGSYETVTISINGVESPSIGKGDYRYMRKKTNGGLKDWLL